LSLPVVFFPKVSVQTAVFIVSFVRKNFCLNISNKDHIVQPPVTGVAVAA
jgi:hypothetical protein